MKCKYTLALLVLALIITGWLQASEITITAAIDNPEVYLGQNVNLQITIGGGITSGLNPKLPDLSNFRVYQPGVSQNISIVNGKMSASFSYNYTLVPLKTGNFIIGEIKVEYQGKEYFTPPIPIKVLSSSAAPAPPPGIKPTQEKSPHTQGKGRILLATSQVDKHTVYVDQQVIYTFRFYRTVNLVSSPQFAEPTFTGFITEKLKPYTSFETTLDGRYANMEESSYALFPTAPGDYTIPPITLRCEIQAPPPQNSDPFNDAFFKNFFSQGQVREITSDEVKIKVIPLPENKPADFSGAVGSYQVTASLDKSKSEVNSPVTLKISVSGQGNLKTVNCPKLPVLDEFKLYEPANSLNLSKSNNFVQGSKEFSIVMIPLKAGNYTIPPISFTYFNPETKTYSRTQSKALKLKIEPGPGNLNSIHPNNAATSTANPKPEFKEDIRYIHVRPERDYVPLYHSRFYLTLLFLPWLIFAILILVNLLRRVIRQTASSDRRSGAYKTAKRKLIRLEAGKEIAQILPSISKILNEYLQDKFSFTCEGMSLEQLTDFLQEHRVASETTKLLKEIYENADCARYAPTQLAEKSVLVWKEKGMKVLERLEKELK